MYSKYDNFTQDELLAVISSKTTKYNELMEQVKLVKFISQDAPELNMSNFDKDEVETLNASMILIFEMLNKLVE